MTTANVEIITPEVATCYLSLNIDNNRNINKRALKSYVKQMKDGRWQLNGDAIKFNNLGQLVDGQHRLQAVIESETTISSMVIKGLPSDAFLTMDTGRKRISGDVLAIEGYKNTNTLAGAVTAIVAIDKAWSQDAHNLSKTNGELSHREVLDYVTANPALVDACQIVCSEFTKVRGYISPSYAVALYYKFSQKDEVLAANFFHGLSTGLGLTAESVIYQLREKLISNLGVKGINKLSVGSRVALTVKAWNSLRKNKVVKSLRIIQGESIQAIL